MTTPFHGTVLHAGEATGHVLRLSAPLSFWGGTDEQGYITDPHHPQCGERLTGRVVILTGGRGSSSSSSVLAEQIRAGCGPAALLLAERDAIITLGAIAAAELYDVRVPVILFEPDQFAALPTSGTATVSEDGTVSTV